MDKKRLKNKLDSITYMQASLGLFVLSLLLTLYLFIKAISGNGNLGLRDALLGMVALLASLTGFGLPLYGRYILKGQARPDYRLGLLLNGAMMLILIFFYFLGIP